jgi:hypothetical protein
MWTCYKDGPLEFVCVRDPSRSQSQSQIQMSLVQTQDDKSCCIRNEVQGNSGETKDRVVISNLGKGIYRTFDGSGIRMVSVSSG